MQWKLRNNETGEERLFKEGDDVAEFLSVVKYEPALPSHMRARIIGVDYDATHGYDFDNIKKKPTLFEDGEEVVVTEKIHGTFIQVGVVPSSVANEKYYGGRVIVSSKGMGAKGFVLDHNDETNLYAQAAKKHNLFDIMLERMGPLADMAGKPVFLMGEVFGRTLNGKDVQDGMSYNDEPLAFRAFDICVGNRGVAQYMTHNEFRTFCDLNGVPRVPVLYRGPYSKRVVLDHTDGFTTLADKQQIREGVVVKSAVEARNPHYGRKIAKSVSEAYLLRKGGTEFQ
jgi:RNA ligase (TIGR02306 family)